jgi:peptidyl-prolyl cis-trans isomerase C
MMAAMRSSRRAALPALLLLAACSGRRPADPVILALDGQVVRRSEFERHLEALRARGLENADDPGVRRNVLDAFLEQRLLVLEARRLGRLEPSASPEQEQSAARSLLAEAAARVDVADAEIEAYYVEHREELARPEQVTLRQILVPTLNEARDVKRRLARDPRSFESLAQTRSRAPEASAGGLMGTFSRGELPPDLESAAFDLKPGAASEPVQTPLGYHVMRVEARSPPRERELEECRAEIRHALLRTKAEAAEARLLRSLFSRAKVNHEAAQSPGRT